MVVWFSDQSGGGGGTVYGVVFSDGGVGVGMSGGVVWWYGDRSLLS